MARLCREALGACSPTSNHSNSLTTLKILTYSSLRATPCDPHCAGSSTEAISLHVRYGFGCLARNPVSIFVKETLRFHSTSLKTAVQGKPLEFYHLQPNFNFALRHKETAWKLISVCTQESVCSVKASIQCNTIAYTCTGCPAQDEGVLVLLGREPALIAFGSGREHQFLVGEFWKQRPFLIQKWDKRSPFSNSALSSRVSMPQLRINKPYTGDEQQLSTNGHDIPWLCSPLHFWRRLQCVGLGWQRHFGWVVPTRAPAQVSAPPGQGRHTGKKQIRFVATS